MLSPQSLPTNIALKSVQPLLESAWRYCNHERRACEVSKRLYYLESLEVPSTAR
jgi:hypothetical protein